MSSVLVHGITQPANEDKLTIHFQKRKNNGGDVDSIIYPLTPGQSDSALINFDEEGTADCVISVDQIYNGVKLNVQKEYKVFSQIQATINEKLIKKLIMARKKEEVLNEIRTKSCVQVIPIASGVNVAGSWHEIQCAREVIAQMLKALDLSATPSHSTARAMSSQVTSRPNHRGDADFKPAVHSLGKRGEATMTGINVISPGTQIDYFFVDRDVIEYVNLFHHDRLGKIEREHGVHLRFDHNDRDETNVKVFKADAHGDGDGQAVKRKVYALTDAMQNEFHHDAEQLSRVLGGNKPPSALLVAQAIDSVRDNYPNVYSRQTVDDPDQVVFIGDDGARVDVAKRWFATVLRELNGKVTVAVDKSYYGFMKLKMSREMKQVLSDTRTAIDEKKVQDAVILSFPSKGPGGDGDSSEAGKRFEKMVSDVQHRAVQEHVKVGDYTDHAVAEAIRVSEMERPNVYVCRSVEYPQVVILTSDDKEQLEFMKDFFAQVLKAKSG